jgi:hypothetical protein
MHNTLMIGRGDGSFAQIAHYAGLAATDWSWSVVCMDVDLDGWIDILVANGNPHDVLDMDAQNELDRATPQSPRQGLQFYPPLPQRNLAYRNTRNLRFEDVSLRWGIHDLGISQTMAVADLDGDGDKDLVVGNLNSEAWIYENTCPAPRILVRLRGNPPNTGGIGARVTWQQTQSANVPPQSIVVVSGGRYLAGDDPCISFAADPKVTGTLKIQWPSGRVQTLDGIEAQLEVEVVEPASPASSSTHPPPPTQPWFTDISPAIHHSHVQNSMNEFELQPTLPQRLSGLAPGISIRDALHDTQLRVPNGSVGGWSQWIASPGNTNLTWVPFNVPSTAVRLETSINELEIRAISDSPHGVLISHTPARPDAARSNSILSGASLVLQTGEVHPLTPKSNASDRPLTSIGGISQADLDGDGSLEIFLGGWPYPGRFPHAALSEIRRWDPTTQQWNQDTNISKALAGLGMVGGSVFFDVDLDGDQDLIVAQTWGGLNLFTNHQGQMQPANPEIREAGIRARFSEWTGLWRGISVGDWNEDGLPDLLIANEGLNHFRAEHPVLELWYGDFAESGRVDCIEAWKDPDTGRSFPIRGWDRLSAHLPFLKETASSYRHFGEATVHSLFGDRLGRGQVRELREFKTTLLLQAEGFWKSAELPPEAQFAPVFGVSNADFNGDGHEDLFLAQNATSDDAEFSRQDAGQGLMLLGDGRGRFTSMPARESGIVMHGHQRGVGVADWNKDGRVDLVVAEAGAPTRLWQNLRSRPGIQLQLVGQPGNPEALGCTVRWKAKGRWGPRKFVHSGDGLFSGSTRNLILHPPEEKALLEIRWPGGSTIFEELTTANRHKRVLQK